MGREETAPDKSPLGLQDHLTHQSSQQKPDLLGCSGPGPRDLEAVKGHTSSFPEY